MSDNIIIPKSLRHYIGFSLKEIEDNKNMCKQYIEQIEKNISTKPSLAPVIIELYLDMQKQLLKLEWYTVILSEHI